MLESKRPRLDRSRLPLAEAYALTGRAWRRYRDSEDGSLLIFGVYIFVLILMLGGIGIDLMRFERDRSNISTRSTGPFWRRPTSTSNSIRSRWCMTMPKRRASPAT
jgi:hypothetical protein